MKKFKNIPLFILAFVTSTQIYGSENQDSDFRQETTDKYIYNKAITTQKHGTLYTSIFGKHPNGSSVIDNTSEDLLSNRVTRRRVETKTENGVSIISTETWISRNPSYITWINGALVVGAVASIVLGAATIGALGNMGAASVNAYGNVTSSAVDAAGNIGVATMNNPESVKVLGNAATQVTKELNKNPELQKMLQNINASIEQKQQ